MLRRFHGSPACAKSRPVPTEFINEDDRKRDKSLVGHDDLFEQVTSDAKTKATFNKVVDVFIKRDVRRRGHVEFIYAALKKMPEFGVERDLVVYNRLLDVFPKEVFVPRNFIQRMFNHYPRQQECGVQLLEQMENYGGCLLQHSVMECFGIERAFFRTGKDALEMSSFYTNTAVSAYLQLK